MDGIILAGGKSTRMNQNKMLLPIDGKPLIMHTIESMRPFVDRIIVVTGKYDQEIRDALKNEPIIVIYNKDYELGMFSSVKVGVENTQDDFFLIPGDCPFVDKSTYQKLLEGVGDIRVPSYRGEDGHPIYISKIYKNEILNMSLDLNLKVFRDSHKYEIINVEDKNIVNNINNINDYLSLNNL